MPVWVIEDEATPAQLASVGARGLYGLYQGVPRTEGWMPSGMLPPRIAIYMHPLVDHFPEDGGLSDQVRITVLHELGHHLGFDEDALEDLGYG